MKLKGSYEIKEIAGEVVAIYCTEDIADLRRAISLKGSAKILFEELQKGAEKKDLIELLTQNYNIKAEDAKSDVESFLRLLLDNNLLEG